MNEHEEVEITIAAMKSVGINSKEAKEIFTVIAAILHLGNSKFTTKVDGGLDGCQIVNRSSSLEVARRFLQIDHIAVEQCLTFRELQAMAPGGKTVTYQVPRNIAQAAARLDTLAKVMFERLFNLIVEQINIALDSKGTLRFLNG